MKTRARCGLVVYIAWRVSATADRFLRATSLAEMQQAAKWGNAWASAGAILRRRQR